MKNNTITRFKKLVFLWKKPKIILIACENEEYVASTVSDLLKMHLAAKIIEEDVSIFDFFGDKILILKAKPERREMLKFLLSKSKFPVLVLCGVGKNFSKNKYIIELVKSLNKGFLILNSDHKYFQEIGKESKSTVFSLGLQNKADFSLSDTRINGDTNFKISYRGNIVPFWLSGIASEEKIYSTLVAASIGELIGLNLVKTSKTLKEV